MMPADRDHHNIFLFYFPSVLFSISVICCLVRVLAELYHGTDEDLIRMVVLSSWLAFDYFIGGAGIFI